MVNKYIVELYPASIDAAEVSRAYEERINSFTAVLMQGKEAEVLAAAKKLNKETDERRRRD